MYSVTKCFALLALAGLSSCSIARHGPLPVPDARVNWPQSLSVGGQSAGQIVSLRMDHGHSIFNYKHANKAGQARYLMATEGMPVNYPQPGLTRVANYKTPLPGGVPVGGLVFEHRLTTDLADHHYKMPRPARLLLVPLPNRSGQPVAGERINPVPSSETLNRLPVRGNLNPVSPVYNLN